MRMCMCMCTSCGWLKEDTSIESLSGCNYGTKEIYITLRRGSVFKQGLVSPAYVLPCVRSTWLDIRYRSECATVKHPARAQRLVWAACLVTLRLALGLDGARCSK